MLYYLDHAEHLVCDAYPSNIALSLLLQVLLRVASASRIRGFKLYCNAKVGGGTRVPFSPLSVVLSSTLKSSLSVAICRQESR